MGMKAAVIDYLTIKSPTRPHTVKKSHEVIDATLSLVTLPLRLLVALWPPLTVVASVAVVVIYTVYTAG